MDNEQTLAAIGKIEPAAPVRWTRWRIRQTRTELWVISKTSIVVFGKKPNWPKPGRRLGNSDARRVFARKLRFKTP